MSALLLQTLFSIAGTVVATVIGFFALRALRRIDDTGKRTEKQVSQLDIVSTSSWRTSVEQRIEGLADQRSGQLAWQLAFDARLAAVERFARDLSKFAHGDPEVPTYIAPQHDQGDPA